MGDEFKIDEFEGIVEVSVVDAEQVQSLSQIGWKLLKVVSSQSKEGLCKQFPYMPQGNYSPSTYPYTEDAVIQRSKFVMGRPENIRSGLQDERDEATRLLYVEREAHEKAKKNLGELGTELTKKFGEITRLTGELKTMTERHENMSKSHEDLRLRFEKLQTATLETLIKLPGGNEVSLDAAGKMVRTGEIMGG